MGKHNRARLALGLRTKQHRSLGGWVNDQGVRELADMARSARLANKSFGRRLLSRAELAGTSEKPRLTSAPLPQRSATNQPTSPIPLGAASPTAPIPTALA